MKTKDRLNAVIRECSNEIKSSLTQKGLNIARLQAYPESWKDVISFEDLAIRLQDACNAGTPSRGGYHYVAFDLVETGNHIHGIKFACGDFPNAFFYSNPSSFSEIIDSHIATNRRRLRYCIDMADSNVKEMRKKKLLCQYAIREIRESSGFDWLNVLKRVQPSACLCVWFHGMVSDEIEIPFEEYNEDLIFFEGELYERESLNYCEHYDEYTTEETETVNIDWRTTQQWSETAACRHAIRGYLSEEYFSCEYEDLYYDEDGNGDTLDAWNNAGYHMNDDGYMTEENDVSRVCGYHEHFTAWNTIGTTSEEYGFATIGFEIEKTDWQGATDEGDEISESRLIALVTEDSSCGVEGITHPIACGDYETGGDAIQNCPAVDSDYDKSCGGHVTIRMRRNVSVPDISPHMGIIYAMYRYRLNNHYCSGNKRLEYCESKYSVAKDRSNGVEIRLPGAVVNRTTLKNRFRIFSEMAYAIHNHLSTDEYAERIMPILESIYEPGKLSRILELAKEFQEYIETGTVSTSIRKYIND